MELRPAAAKEIPVAQAIYNTGWGILKKYYHITEDNEQAWKSLVNEVHSLCDLGTDEATRKLSKAMALSILGYIEQVSKGRRIDT